MALTPRSPHCLVPFTAGTKKALSALFVLLRHPYLLPIEFVELLPKQQNCVLMWPLVVRGRRVRGPASGSPRRLLTGAAASAI